MSIKDLTPRREGLTSPLERMRSLVESMDRMLPADVGGPEMTVKESPKRFVVAARLPGWDKRDVTVDVTDRVITVAGSRSAEKGDARAYESFSRSFGLPADVKREAVEAQFEDGVLTVVLPKTRETPVRRVAVE